MDPSPTNSTVRGAALSRYFKQYLPVILIAVVVGFVLRGCFAPAQRQLAETPANGAAAAPQTEVWTCSMHPQIRSPRPGLCPICAMDLIPVDADEGAAGARMFSTSAEAAALMNIQTMPVERRFVDASIRMVGKVEFDETRLAYITAWVPGRIDKLYVDYTGITVNRGDHMVDLYSPQLISAQEELRQARRTFETLSGGAPAVRQTAQATLEASRERLRLWGLTPQQIERAEQGVELSDHVTIYAPVGGTVIDREGTEGQYVETGTRIYTLADLNQMWVMLDAYESDLQWLRYGQTVGFTAEAYPGEVFEGTISFIDPFLNPRTRTAKVRVNVPNPRGMLKPEMFVRGVVHSRVAEGGRVMEPDLAGKWICPMHPEVVRDDADDCPICGMDLVPVAELGYVPVDEVAQAAPLIIPTSAALVTGTRAVVYVKVPDMERPTFEGREIVLGPRAGDYYIVRSGLREGDQVVVNGNFKIDSALQIMAKASMMTPEGGAAVPAHHHDTAGTPHDAHDADDPGAGAPEVRLSRAGRAEFDAVLAAYLEMEEAVRHGRRPAVTAALEEFARRLEAVDLRALPGEAHELWTDYQQRLTNDAVEAQFAQAETERTRVLAHLRTTMRDFVQRLGLDAPAETADRIEVAEAFREQLRGLYEAYLAMQDALAADAPDPAQAAADRVAQALDAIDMGLLEGEAHMAWMPLAQALEGAVRDAQGAGDIDGMRTAFLTMSNHLIEAIERFGVAEGEPVYQIHCPMAFGGDGGDWLQPTTTVRNPYYGAAMLACGDVVDRLDEPAGHPAAPAPAGPAPALGDAPDAFQDQLRAVYTAYIEVSEQFVESDFAGAQEAASALPPAIAAIDMTLLSAAAHEEWMPLHETLESAAAAIEGAADLDAMRLAFEPLSNALADAITRFGIAEGSPVYRVHCPMAMDNAGADWLHTAPEVLNPYYGDAMLRCGRVVERLDEPA
jgi:membrane fusion protein, copper/silver efflux system